MTVPLPSFTVGAANYIEALADHKRKQTLEVIQAVRSDGWVRVVNTWVPVTGKVQLRAGQTVAVMWRNGTPQVAMMNQARRGGGDVPPIQVGMGVVEEIWIATRPEDGVQDVWFRNFDQCVPLHVDRWGIFPTSLRWGQANDRFLIQSIGTFPFHPSIFYIMKFQRDPYTGFEAGQDAAALVDLERTERLVDSTLVIGSLGASSISGSAPGPYTVPYLYAGPLGPVAVNMLFSGLVLGFLLDDEGHLILVWRLTISGIPLGIASNGERDFAFSAPNNSGPALWAFTVVVDNTRGLTLLDTWTNQSLVSPLATGFGNPTAVDFTDFATTPIVVPGPAEPVGSRAEYVTSETFTNQSVLVWPIAITAADGVRGWVAYAYQQKTANAITYGAAVADDPVDFFGEAVVTKRAGAMVQPPDPTLGPLIFLPMEGTYPNTETGIGFLPTYRRVVWRRIPAGGFFPLQFGPGIDTTVFATLFADGSAFAITDLADDLENRGTHILPTDFFYLLDDARVTQPEGTPVNFFVDAWTFGGRTTLAGVTATSPLPEDAAMVEAKVLADIPEGVTRPRHNLGTEAFLQIVNASAVLEPLGRFTELTP